MEEFKTNELNQIVNCLLDTLDHLGGIGLAAPQIGIDLRIMALKPSVKNPGIPKIALINPAYKPVENVFINNWESCFSIPGFKGLVKRYERIQYSGYNLDGTKIQTIAENWHAFIFQHELDHLDGVTIMQRLTDNTMFGFKDEIEKHFTGNK